MSDITVKVQLDKLLFGLLGRAELVDQWWESPNRAFDMKSPLSVYQSGTEGRVQVKNYILQFCI